ncbi:hypothetical protein HMPREF9296_0426 [Prevotella disiens FB035-09AN]|uniref:Uncharacterized protein n=1 Tax=Prevotella disiens FB035-09AN TaxID=866771 RepID=E1KQ19_9BACT|nr:hypothetical protein HMPREF9296_0426 [Prevotella disiens FB035-09AN]
MIRVVEQSEKITPLQSIITCQKAAILHLKENDFVSHTKHAKDIASENKESLLSIC